jgi:FG-GAP-like repeat
MRSTLILGFLAVAIPSATYFALPAIPPMRALEIPLSVGGSRFAPSPVPFERREIDPEYAGQRSMITNVQILDFDDDGRNDVLICDARRSRVSVRRQESDGSMTEQVLAEDLLAPAHATVVDLDGDGDRDVLVSVLGDILPDDDVVGQLVLLEKRPEGYRRHTLLTDVRRVADCQAGDLDGDGDLDLAVAVFGYARGQVLWLENRGEGHFIDHELLSAPGTIHVPIADFDGDGDLDIATGVTQNEEELYGFENLGGGAFRVRRLWYSINYDLGGAGLVQDDLDGDGDVDLILPVGDNLEDAHSYPQPYHGCLWFENTQGWNFVPHRIAEFGGTYAAATGDLDGDGDRDVVLVSMCNNWEDPRNASVVWLENDGRCQFKTWQIDSQPTSRVTVAVGDLDGDGRNDIVTGGLHFIGPFDRLGGVTAWFHRQGQRAP